MIDLVNDTSVKVMEEVISMQCTEKKTAVQL